MIPYQLPALRISMATIFSETLTKLRKEAGFATAYQFYHGNGGAPVLTISYRKYLAIEQGKNLPVFGRLRGLLLGLRVVPNSQDGLSLVTAWLRTMAGEDNYREILEPMLAEAAPSARMTPMHKAIKSSLAGKKCFITPAQLDVISADRHNYVCFLAMSNDMGEWTAAKLAPLLGLRESDCARALRTLADAKICRLGKRGHYRCPLAARMVEYPRMSATVAEMMGRLMKYQEELIAAGDKAWMRRGIIRADADRLGDFFSLMGLNLSAAHTYTITKKTKRSAIYAVEGRITKLKDF